jgi:quercetin dioxygenase-like cupin family protein
MKTSFLKSRWFAAACAAVLTAAGMTGKRLLAADEPRPVNARQVFSGVLPNVPGKQLTLVQVTYQPGAKSPSHAHAGSVYAYVLSGKIRSEVSTSGPAKVYAAGEGFFEPPGSVHRVSENASDTEPASLLAIFVADEGAQLTKSVPEKTVPGGT